ncbi:MAG: DUF3175 domain-containing protein [Candidatus Eiseniibacteriota bacterium]
MPPQGPGKHKKAGRKQPTRKAAAKNAGRWSGRVTHDSDALDLEADVFTLDDPRRIALSLKRSAEASTRRKSTPFRSAMSMLTFFINRAGSNLTDERRAVLDRAKDELRKVFGRT